MNIIAAPKTLTLNALEELAKGVSGTESRWVLISPTGQVFVDEDPLRMAAIATYKRPSFPVAQPFCYGDSDDSDNMMGASG